MRSLRSFALLTALQLGSPIGASPLHLRQDNNASIPYSIPQSTADSTSRAEGIAEKQAGYLYGPPVAGGGYFPNGTLGDARVTSDSVLLRADLDAQGALVNADTASAEADAAKYNGLKTLADYEELYDGEWKNSMPDAPAPGVLSNYTQDLFFSMERLTVSPYKVRRLDPTKDKTQFDVDDETVTKVTGQTLASLLVEGRLFYADYREQSAFERTAFFSAFCDAYFYIDSKSGDFLPLAIRTNVGSNLIYTPLDDPNDWLLAKIMYNVNDFSFSQFSHLAAMHEVLSLIYLAAIRTLSEDHPVLALLDRLQFEAFAMQPIAVNKLLAPNGLVDHAFFLTGPGAGNYTDWLYHYGGSGSFSSAFFKTDLKDRGLIEPIIGPKLKSFPFYEDANVIFTAHQKFFTALITSYYKDDATVAADKEIAAWVKEAQGPAKVIDFPNINTRQDLIDVLTQVAHTSSSAHQTVNTNDIGAISFTLPFHPPALALAPPTAKSSGSNPIDVASYLPPFAQVVVQLLWGATFSRPLFKGGDRMLIHAYDDAALLARTNDATRAAAATFKGEMEIFSKVVAARGFDGEGLSQGAPFVWKALDPNVAPYALTI